ncbi:hypothetical protein CsSME_00029803 [Camellia sinensis var. sinensis]
MFPQSQGCAHIKEIPWADIYSRNQLDPYDFLHYCDCRIPKSKPNWECLWDCGRDSYARDNVAHDFNHVIGVALPLDPGCHLHCLIPISGVHLPLRRTFQGRSRRVGPTGDCSSLSHHHVCLALRFVETIRV